MLDVYAGAARRDPQAENELRLAIWSARSKAAASVERMLGEPARTFEIDPQRALAVLSAEQRFALANVALKERLDVSPAPQPLPELAGFADVLDEVARSVVAALQNGSSPQALRSIREAHVRLSAAAAGSSNPDAAYVAAQCDRYADAINSIAEAL